jgi:hypothetical protein
MMRHGDPMRADREAEWRRSELTIGEAELWRGAWALCQARMVAECRAMAARAHALPLETCEDHVMAATYDLAADALARIEMPRPMREPPGTEYRG